jgi:hypothetical protein
MQSLHSSNLSAVLPAAAIQARSAAGIKGRNQQLSHIDEDISLKHTRVGARHDNSGAARTTSGNQVKGTFCGHRQQDGMYDPGYILTGEVLLGAAWRQGNVNLSLLADFALDILLGLGLLGLITGHLVRDGL